MTSPVPTGKQHGSIYVHSLVVTALEENCYILWNDSKDCLVIDPGGEAERIRVALAERKLVPHKIINTHGHIDHVGANADLRETTKAPIGIHPLDAPMLESSRLCGAEWVGVPYREHKADFLYEEGQIIGTGKLQFEVFHTPGHSPGSCILLNRESKLLIDGDLVFAGSIGRSDLPGGDEQTLYTSILQKFLVLDDDVAVYPGHGPSTTVGAERLHNPYLVALEQLRREMS